MAIATTSDTTRIFIDRARFVQAMTTAALQGHFNDLTIDEIVAATQWAPHSARGFMSGALKKKLGLTIISEKVNGRARVYTLG